MDVRIVKEDQISIGHINNVTDIIDLPGFRARIIGREICDCCGHAEERIYDTEREDMIILLPRLPLTLLNRDGLVTEDVKVERGE